MATTSDKPSSGTSTRKSSSKPAATTSTKPADADTTDTGTDAATTPSGGEQADPAAALKNRMRTTQHVGDTRPDELTDEQRHNLVGAPAGSLPGPRTLSTPTAPTRKGEAYVTAETDGHVAWIPKYTKQPATVRVWVEGQRVRKDMHDALSGLVAPTAADARVLEGDEYAKAAPFL